VIESIALSAILYVTQGKCMRIFKTRLFAKWAKKEKLFDDALNQAVSEMEQGLIDANLGGHVYKKRVAQKGRGKRGSTRTILVYRSSSNAFFIFGYSKNEKDNVSDDELKQAKAFAKELLSYSETQLNTLVETGKLIEVEHAR